MTKKKVLVFILLLLVFAMLFLFLNRDRIAEKRNSNPYEISVVTRDNSTEGWTTIKQGIDQAAKDMNVEISFVTLSAKNNAQEQGSLMQRELNNGADAIVIAPVDETLLTPIQEVRKYIPVITVQSTVEAVKDLPTISCDNFGLGKGLAEKLVSEQAGSTGKIVILRNSMDCSNISQRYKGVMSVLSGKGFEIGYGDIPDDPREATEAAKKILQGGGITAVIAFDGATLEATGKAKQDLLKNTGVQTKIYGLGRTNTVVSLLENQVINTIGVENEYNLGYLSIQSAVNRINKKADSTGNRIDYAIVDYRNMYNSDNQCLLFPFVR